MTTRIVNLTPHEVALVKEDEAGQIVGFTGFGPKQAEAKYSILRVFPSEGVVRASQREEAAGTLQLEGGGSVEVIYIEFGEITGLPDPKMDIMYIVSVIAANAAKALGRYTGDLLIVADTVRDAEGKILGCQKFAGV